jgi:hypothetical protein
MDLWIESFWGAFSLEVQFQKLPRKSNFKSFPGSPILKASLEVQFQKLPLEVQFQKLP